MQSNRSTRSMDMQEGEAECSNSMWRQGPSKYWYDKYGIPDDAVDYSVVMKGEEESGCRMYYNSEYHSPSSWITPTTRGKSMAPACPDNKKDYPEDAFYLVTQTEWEKDVIWNAEDEVVKGKDKSKVSYAGWIPLPEGADDVGRLVKNDNGGPKEFEPFLSFENPDLVYGRWEDDVIWDAEEERQKTRKPRMMVLNPNDENVILEMPLDMAVRPMQIEVSSRETNPNKQKSQLQSTKSKKLLKQLGVIENVANQEIVPVPFANKVGTAGKKWKIISLAMLIRRRSKEIKSVIESKGSYGANLELMAKAVDLSGRDGELLLVENCEEYPPLLSQVGMCSTIRNYCRRSSSKVEESKESQHHPFGETKLVHASPFLGIMYPGQVLTTLESNLYRCPIYLHSIPKTDFLLIATKNAWLIREYDAVFTAGQHIPLFEVPVPNSNKAKQFLRDFIMVFCYRKFWCCEARPRSFILDEIIKAFPSVPENTLRKWLKVCADFKREGNDCVAVLKDTFSLPSENELTTLVTPEKCCAYYSLIAGEQRLKDAGYSSEKCLFAEIDEHGHGNKSNDLEGKLEDEVKNAPWNTTSAYLQAMKGKCLLQITGPADPTGCGEGFSYVKLPKKSVVEKEEKRNVNGTDSDLRRLPVSGAKSFLKKIGISDTEIKKLSRWEIIDLVRTISTEKSRAGETEKLLTKYSRLKLSVSHNQERYKSECQRIFDLQNKVLSSAEILSSDDEASDGDDAQETIEAMGRNIEQILSNKTDPGLSTFEQEEIERLELQRMMLGDDEKEKDGDDKQLKSDALKNNDDVLTQLSGATSRVLKITRTFTSGNGKKDRQIEEFVKNPDVINAYVKIRTRNSEDTIRKFAQKLNLEEKELLREKKRRMQARLRYSNQEKVAKEEKFKQKAQDDIGEEYFPNLEERKKAEKKSRLAKRKCGACGSIGHFRTSKECPAYDPIKMEKLHKKPKTVASAEELAVASNNSDQKVMSEMPASSNTSDLTSSTDSSSDDSDSSTSSSSDDDDDEQSESEVLRVEGTKLVFRLSQNDLITNSQQFQPINQDKVSTPNQLLPRSRVSQPTREQSDYLSKQYKTTAADRQAKF
ncbi:Transcription initiation factor TFIID subunit 1 [Orchesella cincta]|uniref:Transcription initiation factor TFIID subunit 1 n=1 Tax=Orchesella cincta TaxID=48709 RepID=A0A1D2MEU3_ORCCI|nr:Transcription initiation factor TFIID subunit 1 [Orchesella cincta]